MVGVILNFIFDRGTVMPKARYWLIGKGERPRLYLLLS
jgi:hypothetical protein